MQRNILIESENARAVVASYRAPPRGQRLNNAPLVIMPYGLQKTHEHTPAFFSNISEKLEDLGLTSLLYDYHEQQQETPTEQKLCCKKVTGDLNTLFIWARENNFNEVAFITEGLGAPLLFINLPKNAVFTILLWPVLSLQEFAKNQTVASQANTDIPDELCLSKKFFEEMKKHNLRTALKNVHTPTLILQGQKDNIIPPIHLEEARAHLMAPRLDITTFEDGQHGLAFPKHKKACLQHISNFVKKYAQDDSDRTELFRI